MKLFWYIPTNGDSRHLRLLKEEREASFSYLKQIAMAIDSLGYEGALLPTGILYEDAFAVASSLLSVTEKMKFLVAVRPGVMSPTLAARMTSTIDRLSNGRLLVNVVTGGSPLEHKGEGIHLTHRERYELTDEFLHIWKGVMSGETVNHVGKHLHVEGAKLLQEPVQKPYPALYFGGSSDIAMEVAAKHIDVYLTWGEPLNDVKEKIEKMKAFAAKENRRITFGIRLHVVVRETEEEAWEAANDLLRYVDDASVNFMQNVLQNTESVGQQRMLELHKGNRENLEISPNLWAGIGLVRGGAGTALVGSAENVAERMREYEALGIDTFILSGYPHLEESYRVAELLFPLLQEKKNTVKSNA